MMRRSGRSVLAMAGVTIVAAAAAAGVDLGGAFGMATASARPLSATTMELDLEVEADSEATVVAHLIEPGAGQQTFPLVERTEGIFGVVIEVRRIDYVVVFEALQESLSAQSQPVILSELGVDPAVLGMLPSETTRPDGLSSVTRQWGWAGLGLAALALVMLAIWAFPERRTKDREPDEPAT
ncbi:MAG: hypothetical protein ACT4OP_11790 [Actinomycetota bacterium]